MIHIGLHAFMVVFRGLHTRKQQFKTKKNHIFSIFNRNPDFHLIIEFDFLHIFYFVLPPEKNIVNNVIKSRFGVPS